MKTIIAGSRDITNPKHLHDALDEIDFDITEVVCGLADGVDTMGLDFAIDYKVPYKTFPADWEKYGRKAGPIRNVQMGDYADALIAIWDGKSRGTKHMIEYAKQKKLKTVVFILDKGTNSVVLLNSTNEISTLDI